MTPITTTLRVITPPANEPVTLDDAKEFLRVYVPFEDNLILGLIEAARQMVEQYLGRVLVTQTLLATYKLSPHYVGYAAGSSGTWGAGFGFGSGFQGRHYDGALELPRSPVQSITAVTLRGHDGVDTVITNNAYNLDIELDPAKFRLLWHSVVQNYTGVVMPLEHIQIKFVAGYGGSEYNEIIPRPIIQAIMLYVAHLYEKRGDNDQVFATVSVIPEAIYALCSPYRLLSFGGQ